MSVTAMVPVSCATAVPVIGVRASASPTPIAAIIRLSRMRNSGPLILFSVVSPHSGKRTVTVR
ncbi:hypothetical protein SVIO_001850 [Streptomyces violaceusniger]|uniref:Uncharacterized protein n=1 Tax=Streptomyces violaceusniger TaxID=68280 RepID=A0A4D4KLV8_STRVO|nr:hypothetical protein SVIO_001850 [Streptomyces violaceusniger]